MEHYDVSINMFSFNLNKYESDSNEVLIAGDFNINLIEINDKHIINEYVDVFTNLVVRIHGGWTCFLSGERK